MTMHDRYIEWAADAMTTQLGPPTAAELASHLAECSDCRHRVSQLRQDHVELRALLVAEPSPAADAAIHAELARVERRTSPVVLLMTAAVLLLALLGAVGVGAFLSRPVDGVPTTLLPSEEPRSTAVVDASTAPLASARPPFAVTVRPGAIPVADGSVRLAPGPAGGVYVLTDAPRQLVDGPASRATITLLDASGEPQSGWPIAIEGWSCSTGYVSNPGWAPAPAPDGSVRLVCTKDVAGDGPGPHVAFAFDDAGRALPGWPVELPAGEIWEQPRVVGDSLYVVTVELRTDDAGSLVDAASWLTSVAPDGTIVEGERVGLAAATGIEYVRLGPDGTAYAIRGMDANGDGAFGTFEVQAFDLDGPKPGWPVRIEEQGVVGDPAFGPNGRIYFVAATRQPGVDATASPTRVLAFERDGRAVPLEPFDIPAAATDIGTMAGLAGIPMAPLVAADGSIIVVGDGDVRAAVFGLDASGAAAAGWPDRSAVGLQLQGGCGVGDTGCGVFRARPELGPGNVVLLPLSAEDPGSGGSLLAITLDREVLPGWPVRLEERDAGFWSITAAQGLIHAVTVEFATEGRASATVLGIDQDGTIRYRTPIVVP